MYKKLLHSEVFIPEDILEESIDLQTKIKNVISSLHLSNQASKKHDYKHFLEKDKVVEIVKNLANNPIKPFEIELSKGYKETGIKGFFISKIVIRTSYDEMRDVIIPIALNYVKGKITTSDCLIKTAWLNYKTDQHYTLDESKYLSKKDYYIEMCR